MDELLTIIRTISAIIIVCVVVAVVAACGWKIKKHNKNTDIKTAWHGEADGILFGENKFSKKVYSPAAAEGHVIVIGGSGAGKTSAILIPTLRAWGGTSLIIDISGDISANVECPNKLVFAPSEPDSAPYDVFALIDSLQDIDDKNQALEQLSFLIMPEQINATPNSKYFEDGGRNILCGSLIAFYYKDYDFCTICDLIISNDYKSLFSLIDETGNELASKYIANFLGNNEANISGCKQNCDVAIKLFAINSKVRASVRRPLKDEKAVSPASIETHNVFIKIPDEKMSVYAPLLHIISAQCLSYFSARSQIAQNNVLFCLDEFASLGKLEITPALRKLRKQHIRIMVLTQSVADIEEIYGDGAHKSMLENFKYKLLLQVAEPDSQEYFSKLIGQNKVLDESTTSQGIFGLKKSSTTKSYKEEYIVQPAGLAHLGDYLLLLHPAGVMKLKKAYYFKEKERQR